MKQTQPHIAKARDLRRWTRQSRVMLWDHLRNCRLCAMRFRSGTPLAGKALDFYRPQAALVFEVTGKGQDRRILAWRNRLFQQAGFPVLPIQRAQILADMPNALTEIAPTLAKRLP